MDILEVVGGYLNKLSALLKVMLTTVSPVATSTSGKSIRLCQPERATTIA